jgi:hypothetical protein
LRDVTELLSQIEAARVVSGKKGGNSMLRFMQEGGYSMWLILVLGLLSLGLAASFAVRPAERKLNILRPLSLATVFSILGAISADIGTVMKRVPQLPEFTGSPDVRLALYTSGIGESMVPAILGFTVLSLVWILAAVGFRRS